MYYLIPLPTATHKIKWQIRVSLFNFFSSTTNFNGISSGNFFFHSKHPTYPHVKISLSLSDVSIEK